MSNALIKRMLKIREDEDFAEEREVEEDDLTTLFDNFRNYEFGDDPMSNEELLGK